MIDQTVTNSRILLLLRGNGMSIKIWNYILLLGLTVKTNMTNRTQASNKEFWNEEASTFLKGREVITENISLLKYQKQAMAAVLNGGDAFMLLPNSSENRGYIKFCPL